jgi:hypothetical protein
MGVRFPSVSTTTFVGPLPANANETVVLTTPPLNISLDFAQIILLWMGSILTGATTNNLIYRIRRGTTTAGTFIGALSWQEVQSAAVATTMSGIYVDTPGAVAEQQYSLTVVQQAATGAGTWQDGCLLAFAL